jgi:hypothetical protein
VGVDLSLRAVLQEIIGSLRQIVEREVRPTAGWRGVPAVTKVRRELEMR